MAPVTIYKKLHVLFKLQMDANMLVLHYTWLEKLVSYKQSSLLCPFKTQIETDCEYGNWCHTQHFIFFIAYEWAQKARVFVPT
jgi:hypothetical protein